MDPFVFFMTKAEFCLRNSNAVIIKDYSEDLDVDDRIILKCIASRLQGWKFRGSNPGRGLRFF